VTTIAERILDAIRYAALDDDVLAKRLGVTPRQSGQSGRPEAGGAGDAAALRRRRRQDRERLIDESVAPPAAEPPTVEHAAGALLTEDEVRPRSPSPRRRGLEVVIAWGRTRGIDIEALHRTGVGT
jgi:hypothetical protein